MQERVRELLAENGSGKGNPRKLEERRDRRGGIAG